jgi:hypothetical protein
MKVASVAGDLSVGGIIGWRNGGTGWNGQSGPYEAYGGVEQLVVDVVCR